MFGSREIRMTLVLEKMLESKSKRMESDHKNTTARYSAAEAFGISRLSTRLK